MTNEELHNLSIYLCNEFQDILTRNLSKIKYEHEFLYIHSFVVKVLMEALIELLISISGKESAKCMYDMVTESSLKRLLTQH